MPLNARLLHLALSVLLLAPIGALAGQTTPLPRNDTVAGLDYLVFETGRAAADAPLPMVVGLHYSSAEPSAMVEYFDSLGLAVRVVLPRGPYVRRAGRSWFPSEIGLMGQLAQDAVAFDSAGKVAAFIAAARERHPTRGKPVVAGVSYGGDLAVLLALRHPDQVAASFAIAARVLPGWLPATNACRPHCPPIHALHGEEDATVLIGPTQAGIAQLSSMGFDARLTRYPGAGHAFDARMERDFAKEATRLLGAGTD